MPKRILDPYFSYIDNLEIQFQIGKTIGNPHRDICSIPQGCPFSMTMTALLMVPWVNLMRTMKVEPRVLADDLMFTAIGDGHCAKTVRAMDKSRQYFQDLGARVAHNKCFTFSTDAPTRRFLTNYRWDDKGTTIPNFTSFRDLGAHMNLAANSNGATLTARMEKATKMAKRLKWMPITREAKLKIVQANILPAALYGVEITHINKGAMQNLRSAIASVIGSHSAKRSIDLVFASTPTSKDLDPLVHVMYLRAANLRRIMSKDPEVEQQVRQSFQKYQDIQNGTNQVYTHKHIAAMQTRYNNLTLWQNTNPLNDNFFDDLATNDYQGPVGLLIKSLEQNGSTINPQLIIETKGEPDIDLWNIPWQHLKRQPWTWRPETETNTLSMTGLFVGASRK